ncbi:MAG TPA: monofunctional biosynthetic peptidoglycan transglycosylase [Bacteroidales bacterium]|jgi:monofunctional biosynthetic peptidoglycan transglycosylase|nr:monofunctional biosynthetic peptidoglycan transglycosylase [Bacteroidales bacterium]MDI9574524.1 monofunctional biosynthetic peptidoglycan transglycosylase [Bacteroidota bacterium]MBP9511781.1 monofunctional biosynthetic peptidoglycan transglycosylase [Bacteroidales bacterium]MBP9588806.1 monofunctional biosynthetic peptidoglycan transglycosylase [Bacteroidales bacterium]HNQ60327.1 monofunctional biosynthetic peptidoglycan transglycosylase [Bacteroidales bacterium]
MKKLMRRVLKWIRNIILILIGLSLFFTLLYKFVPVYYTPLMFIRYFENVKAGKEARIERNWKRLDEISPNLWLAVVASEDNNFLKHHGFDMDAIKKAQKHNQTHARKRGASTISQQVAKNVFLWPSRTWVRKGLETYFTFLIETFWSKKRILEVYLNVIEIGPGIYGAEAASQIYFHKPASKLTRGEAALIAAVLPAPLRRNPAKPSPYVLSRQQWILWNMNNIGKIEFD